MKKSALLILTLCLLPFTAGGLTIKLGSLAPAGSPWDAALRRIAMEWGQISSGRVELKIYSGGTAGDEPDMVRKVHMGQLGATAITVSTIQEIFNGVKVLSFPLFIRSDEEFTSIFGRMRPFYEKELESRGYKVLMWSYGGWVYFFSRRPISTPDDLRRQKLWVWEGDPDEVQAWQGMGFQVVPLASTDLLSSLQSGMVDAFVTSPLVAASSQWFGIASHMCGIKLAPMWGALIVSTKEWAKVPAELQPRLAEAAARIGTALTPEIARADQDAVSTMAQYGLSITQVPRSAEAEWQEIFEKGIAYLVGKSYDAASYRTAKSFLDEYLATHPRN
jgi:TRAP-type C4-dicarboxylate transport system substrate-binding protein